MTATHSRRIFIHYTISPFCDGNSLVLIYIVYYTINLETIFPISSSHDTYRKEQTASIAETSAYFDDNQATIHNDARSAQCPWGEEPSLGDDHAQVMQKWRARRCDGLPLGSSSHCVSAIMSSMY